MQYKLSFIEFITVKIIMLFSTLVYAFVAKNNGNNGDVAYASLDLTLVLMHVTSDNVLQHCRHLLRTHFNDLHKCAPRSKN